MKKYKKDEFRQAQILRKFLLERNFTVKISIVALGELTAIAVRENRLYLLDNLKRFMKKFGDNLKLCYSPRLRRYQANFHDIIARLIEADEWLLNHPADTLILAYAVFDEQADKFYTTDSSILLSKGIREEVKQIRDDYNLPELEITGLNIKVRRRKH